MFIMYISLKNVSNQNKVNFSFMDSHTRYVHTRPAHTGYGYPHRRSYKACVPHDTRPVYPSIQGVCTPDTRRAYPTIQGVCTPDTRRVYPPIQGVCAPPYKLCTYIQGRRFLTSCNNFTPHTSCHLFRWKIFSAKTSVWLQFEATFGNLVRFLNNLGTDGKKKFIKRNSLLRNTTANRLRQFLDRLF